MTLVRRSQCAGFTLFELILSISLIAILMGFLFDRMLYYQEVVEQAMMRQTVNMIDAGMNLTIADWITKGESRKLSELERRNPMEWLAAKPVNYVGELYDPREGEVPAGSWYYDLKDGSLVYLVKRGAHFRGDGHEWIRFRVHLNYNADYGGVGGARLVPEIPYSWFAH